MPGKIRFDNIPQLPADWWEQDDATSVWPTWGRETDYFWGANQGNQFLARGESLAGGGLAGPHGPSRGRAHPQYVGVDTMSGSDKSLHANQTVYDLVKTHLAAGHQLVVPVDLREGKPDYGKFSLGTGIAILQPEATQIHSHIWAAILELISSVESTEYFDQMWTPDLALPPEQRQGSRVELPNLDSIQAYAGRLAKAANDGA